MGGLPKLGVQFCGPKNKDHSISGSISGSPIYGNYHRLPYALFRLVLVLLDGTSTYFLSLALGIRLPTLGHGH